MISRSLNTEDLKIKSMIRRHLQYGFVRAYRGNAYRGRTSSIYVPGSQTHIDKSPKHLPRCHSLVGAEQPLLFPTLCEDLSWRRNGQGRLKLLTPQLTPLVLFQKFKWTKETRVLVHTRKEPPPFHFHSLSKGFMFSQKRIWRKDATGRPWNPANENRRHMCSFHFRKPQNTPWWILQTRVFFFFLAERSSSHCQTTDIACSV